MSRRDQYFQGKWRSIFRDYVIVEPGSPEHRRDKTYDAYYRLPDEGINLMINNFGLAAIFHDDLWDIYHSVNTFKISSDNPNIAINEKMAYNRRRNEELLFDYRAIQANVSHLIIMYPNIVIGDFKLKTEVGNVTCMSRKFVVKDNKGGRGTMSGYITRTGVMVNTDPVFLTVEEAPDFLEYSKQLVYEA